jgi:hypothetical protein
MSPRHNDPGDPNASLDRSERTHAGCRALIGDADEPVAIPSPVLCEVDHLIHRRLGAEAMPMLLRDVERGAYRLEELTLDDVPRMAQLMERYADLDVGFVDAAILAIVERLGEPKLATLDRKRFSVMQPRHVDALELLPA